MNDSRTKQRSRSHVQIRNNISLRELSEQLPSIDNYIASRSEDLQPFDNQVAGHQYGEGKENYGILKCKDGTILKPITKEKLGRREVQFYERLQYTTDQSLLEFKEFCTNYYGTRTINVEGKNIEYLILDDITDTMVEPCIIDIKIGKITSDPEATPEKVASEKLKYKQCKDDVSFCIPGFQVYKISTDKFRKYNKEYGKKLDGNTVIEALKTFLNADGNRVLCRELIVKLLSILWKIQKWARSQKILRLFSSSILIVYDCKNLKKIMNDKNNSDVYQRAVVKSKLTRKVSFNSPEGYTGDSAGRFSGQISETGPILKLSTTPVPKKIKPVHGSKSMVFHKPSIEKKPVNVTRSHSFHHNYNDYIVQLKKNYASTLKELINDKPNRDWFDVKIIDFAHVFPAEDSSRDVNYLEGIDSLVRIFESFLELAE